MDITLNILAEQIILLENNGDQSRDSNLEKEDVILHIKQVASNIVSTGMSRHIAKKDNSIDLHYIHKYGQVSVKKDTETDLYYSTLPSIPFALKQNRGIKEIYAGVNYDKPMKPIEMGTISMFKDAMAGETMYSIEKDRVWYYNVKKQIKTVTMRIVSVANDDIADDDQFYLPLELQSIVIQEVRKILQTTAQEDLTNDSKDIKP